MLENNAIKHRKRKGLTVQQLAAITGIGATTIMDIEKGHNKPTIPTIYKLSRALGVTIDELVFDEDKKGTSE